MRLRGATWALLFLLQICAVHADEDAGDIPHVCETYDSKQIARYAIPFKLEDPEKRTCFTRIDVEKNAFGCHEECNELAPAVESKMACLDSTDKISAVHEKMKETGDTLRVVWSPLVRQANGVDWAADSCTGASPTLEGAPIAWQEGEPNNSSHMFESDGSPAGGREDCAAYLMGETDVYWSLPSGWGTLTTPSLMDVGCGSPNPGDIFCMCEYKATPAISPPPAPPPTIHGCSSSEQLPEGGISGSAIRSELNAGWGDRCYAQPASLYEDNGTPKQHSQAECAAECAKFPQGGHIFCPNSEEEMDFLYKVLIKNQKMSSAFFWTSLVQDPSADGVNISIGTGDEGEDETVVTGDPTKGWAYQGCSSSYFPWAGLQETTQLDNYPTSPAATGPFGAPTNMPSPMGGAAEQDCATLLYGDSTQPPIFGSYPFLLDTGCTSTRLTNFGFPPNGCMCEYDGFYPPGSPPFTPPSPPPPPSPPSPPLHPPLPPDPSPPPPTPPTPPSPPPKTPISPSSPAVESEGGTYRFDCGTFEQIGQDGDNIRSAGTPYAVAFVPAAYDPADESSPQPKCYGRASGDYEKFSLCSAACASMNQVSGFPKKMACIDTMEKVNFMQSAFISTSPLSASPTGNNWFWSPLRQEEDSAAEAQANANWTTFAPDTCSNNFNGGADAPWADGEPTDETLFSVDGEGSLSAYEDCSIFTFGKAGYANQQSFGDPPYMMDVNCESPNPQDVQCWCEYDAVKAFDPPPSPPPVSFECFVPDVSSSGIDGLTVVADHIVQKPPGATWEGSCYAKVLKPLAEGEEGGELGFTQPECEAACGAMPLGQIFCPTNEAEMDWIEAGGCMFGACNINIQSFWTSLKQHHHDLESMEPDRKWWFDDPNGRCPGGFMKWGHGGIPAAQFPTQKADDFAPGAPGPQSCANFVLATDAALPSSVFGDKPFMIDVNCEAPWTDLAMGFTQCICEFQGNFPPPSSPPSPPVPPSPPQPPSPPPYHPIKHQYAGVGSPTVIGATIGVSLVFFLIVMIPAFVFYIKWYLPKALANAAKKNRVQPEPQDV